MNHVFQSEEKLFFPLHTVFPQSMKNQSASVFTVQWDFPRVEKIPWSSQSIFGASYALLLFDLLVYLLQIWGKMYWRERVRKIDIVALKNVSTSGSSKKSRCTRKKKMCVSDSMTLWLSILEKQTLNLSSVFSKGLCNSKVCALRSKSKFAEALLKYRLHKPGCFEIILQWGEHLRGRLMFFVQSIGASRKRDASVKRFFTHWPFFHS